ncbi:MAG: hypothetical protein O3A00_00625 [Planctomycetota bacterium]|nr:hypothetical protein [Planctomycetota bacterium]
MSRSFSSLIIPVGFGCAVVMCVFSPGLTDDSTAKSQSAESRIDKTPKTSKLTLVSAGAVTPSDEAIALDFAQAHHPELAGLVIRLQKRMQSQYARAIQELHVDATRINRLQQRLPERYDVELKIWKISSRARLLAARLIHVGNAKAREQGESNLKQLLLELTEAKAAKLKLEEQRLALRLETVRRSIALIQDDSEAAADRELARLKRSLQRYSKTKSTTKNPAKPTAKQVSTKLENN